MKKRFLKCALGMAALLLLGCFAPSIYWNIAGAVRGEAFYAGRPTIYWRGSIKDEQARSKRRARIFFGIGPVTWRDSYDDWKERWLAGRSTMEESMRSDPKAVPVLLELLADPDFAIHKFAFDSVVKQCPETRTVLPRLVDHLISGWRPEHDHVHPGTRNVTYIVLHNETGKDAAPHFFKWLNHPDKNFAAEAAYALGVQGEDAVFAIPQLVEKLDHENDCKASMALAGIGPKAIPALKEVLKRQNRHARLHATNALALMHPGWRNASDGHALAYAERTSLLEQLTKDADPTIQSAAHKGLQP